MLDNFYLGIDTSNYTSSCALIDVENSVFLSEKRLLPVKSGEIGLRQSDAVFHHIKILPSLLSPLLEKYGSSIKAVSASYAPRDVKGSYMPCFAVGTGFAKVVSSSLGVDLYNFSHQSGHIAAAVLSSFDFDLINRPFIAFHISGGTTEALYVTPSKENVFNMEIIGGTLDLNAGQAIDRIGAMLSLPFPAGKYIDDLSTKSSKTYNIKPYFKDGFVSFSGLQNKCADMIKLGEETRDIARFCVDYILAAVKLMTEYAIKKYGDIPVVYSGGVTSNSIIRENVKNLYDCIFASPECSTDNALGTAFLGYIKDCNL